LAEGDGVIFYTDGLSKDWTEQGSSPEQELAKVLRVSRDKAADELQQELTKNVSECARHARKQGLEDDLTAVIVRLERSTAAE
jgi:serine/threonine protein phosphatase PrpC